MRPKFWRLCAPLVEQSEQSVAQACLAVLNTADPLAKLMMARRVARGWRAGLLDHRFDVPMPDYPARPDAPELLHPNRMPRRRKAGSERGRIALLHAIAHIEFSAIDLAFDLIGRFGDGLSRAFVDDWMQVGAEEAMHFALVNRRLKQLGSYYGALAAHEGLWDAAYETRNDFAARLAVVPLVLEARGLDVTPQMISRLQQAGDIVSARILSRIASDEVGHVAAGVKWFEAIANLRNFNAPTTFQSLVKSHFKGTVKPPFNDSARRQAGLTQEYYAALAH